MAMSTGYDYGIRQGLLNKGISNDDIGYNPSTKYVTVKGNNFMKAPKVYNGTSFTSQQDFNTAWDTYNKPKPTPVVQPTVQPTAQPRQTASSNPYDQQTSDMISKLMAQANSPAAVDMNAIYASPQYAASQAQAQRSAQQGIRSAQEALGGAGFGRSTALAERAQGIQNDANEYLQTQILPQLVAQAQAEKQQQLQNQLTMLNQLQGQQHLYDDRFNTANQLELSRADRTGYLPPSQEALGAINRIIDLGEAWKTGDANQRTQYNQEANNLRALLSGMGVDPSLFGADKTTEQRRANIGKAGTPTLAKAQQDYSQMADQRDFDRGVLESDRGYNHQLSRDKVTDAQWQQEFSNRVQQQGVQNALAWAANSLAEDDNARGWAQLDYNMMGDGKYSGLSPSQAIDNIRSVYSEHYDDKSENGGTRITTDPKKREDMFLSVIDMGLGSDAETHQVLSGLGLTREEIAKFKENEMKRQGLKK